MPRLRAVRTKEEALNVPPTEAVEVVLSPDAPEPQDQPGPALKTQQPEPPPEPEDDPSKALQEQLERAKNAERLAQEQLAAAQERERNITRERDESLAQSSQHRDQAEEARYTAVVNALGAANSEAEAAAQAWEAADIAGDSKAKAEAQRRLARAEANVARFEDAKANYEDARETRKREPAPQPRAPADPIEAAIQAMPQGAQGWLRSHPEFITDVRKNARLQAAHWDALDEGHAQFSPAYFESLETRVGLRQKPQTQDIEESQPAPQPRRASVPSAPPSRDVPSATTGRPQSSRVELSPQEREIARLSGIDEITYAKGKLELERRKGMGHYQERG